MRIVKGIGDPQDLIKAVKLLDLGAPNLAKSLFVIELLLASAQLKSSQEMRRAWLRPAS